MVLVNWNFQKFFVATKLSNFSNLGLRQTIESRRTCFAFIGVHSSLESFFLSIVHEDYVRFSWTNVLPPTLCMRVRYLPRNFSTHIVDPTKLLQHGKRIASTKIDFSRNESAGKNLGGWCHWATPYGYVCSWRPWRRVFWKTYFLDSGRQAYH